MADKGSTLLRVVRSDGQEMEFSTGGGAGWRIAYEGMQDWLELPIETTTSPNVLSDGSSVVGKRVSECERTASCFCSGGDLASERLKALSFFNPKHTYSAHVTYYGTTRWAPGELSAVECAITREGRALELVFTLLCPDPYMRSESGNENSLTDSAPMFGFPFVSHFRMPLPDGTKKPVGFLASKLLYDGLNTVYNTGDVETYYTIRCECNGAVKNPTFFKDSRFVRMVGDYQDGDVIVIDFTQAPPSVTVNGVNAIQACSRDSNFTGMAMQVGANVFQYSCDNEANRPLMDVQILFYRKYLGI